MLNLDEKELTRLVGRLDRLHEDGPHFCERCHWWLLLEGQRVKVCTKGLSDTSRSFLLPPEASSRWPATAARDTCLDWDRADACDRA